MILEIVTPPIIEPVTYADILSHLRVDPFDEAIDLDSITYVDGLIASIRKDCEVFTNRVFLSQTWRYSLDKWPETNYIQIPKPPLQSITSVTVLTKDEVSEVLDPVYYHVDTASIKGRVILGADESWPNYELYPMNPIQILFVCGYGSTPEDVPAAIRYAILLQVGDLWDNREDYREGKLIRASERLLWPYRVFF